MSRNKGRKEQYKTYSVVLNQSGGLVGKLLLLCDIVAAQELILHPTSQIASSLSLTFSSHPPLLCYIRNIAKFLLDLTHSLEVSSAVEGISVEEEKLDEVTGHITTSHIETAGQMGQGETLEHRNNVGNTITTVHDNTSKKTWMKCKFMHLPIPPLLFHHANKIRPLFPRSPLLNTLGIQGQHGLDGNIHALELVLLEHSLNHLLAILVRVHGSLCEENLALAGVDL